MHEFVTRTTIKATAERVWRILTDPAGYAEWNPEIVGLAGTMAAGGRIEARVKVGGGAIRTVPMRVTAFEGPLRMEWTGGLPLGLFTGRRIFTLTPAADAVEFRMLVQMIGPLASLMVRAVGDRQTEIDGFSAGLKARAERAGRVDDNAGVEIHDSTLERIESQGSDLVATMDAYVHRSEGEVGVDRGTGWSQSVEFRFRRGRVVTSHATTPLGLRDGRLVLSGQVLDNLIPMPLIHEGPSRMELESRDDAKIVFEGDGVTGAFVGPATYIEEFEP